MRRSSNKMVFLMILLCGFFVFQVRAGEGLSCNSCGDECTQSCGTRHFRTCCFNYLRKRSDPSIKLHSDLDSQHAANDISDSTPLATLTASGRTKSTEMHAFNEGQKARALTFFSQLHRFIFGQISAFFYMQLAETRRFYNMMLEEERNGLQTTAPLIET